MLVKALLLYLALIYCYSLKKQNLISRSFQSTSANSPEGPLPKKWLAIMLGCCCGVSRKKCGRSVIICKRNRGLSTAIRCSGTCTSTASYISIEFSPLPPSVSPLRCRIRVRQAALCSLPANLTSISRQGEEPAFP